MPANDPRRTHPNRPHADPIPLHRRPAPHRLGAGDAQRECFTGVHFEAYIGRVGDCREAVAIGAAATAGDTDIEMIVAVNELGQVVSPCGMCRELIGDYAPEAKVIIPRNGQPVAVSVSKLLPDKYQR